MKYVLLLTFIAFIKSYISSYYTSCDNNPPKGAFTFIEFDECKKHNPSDGHCCHLSYNLP